MSRVYPHTNFQWIDQSAIPEINDPRISKPCYLYAFSADKGPEEMKERLPPHKSPCNNDGDGLC